MREVWIASIFATIMLMLPLNSVVGANEISKNVVSDVDEDCLECQTVRKVDILKVRFLLIKIEAFTNIILSKFGHIPEIRKKCGEISEGIITFREEINNLKSSFLDSDFPIFCKFLEILAQSVIAIGYYGLDFIYGILITLFPKLEYIIWYIFDSIWGIVGGVLTFIGVFGMIFCDWGPYNSKMDKNYI